MAPVCAPLKVIVWLFRIRAKWSRCPFVDLKARVRSSQRSCLCFCTFFSTLFLYYVRNPDNTDNEHHTSSAGCVLQPAGYNAIYTPVARQQSRKQHHACTVACPRCIAVASYSVVAFFIGPLRSGGLCCCVIHACCHRYNSTTAAAAAAAAAAVRLSWAPECGRDFQRLLRCILFFFCKYHLTIQHCCTAAFRVSRVCVRCVTRGVLANSFFLSAVLGFCAGEAFCAVRATTKICTNVLPNTWYLV